MKAFSSTSGFDQNNMDALDCLTKTDFISATVIKLRANVHNIVSTNGTIRGGTVCLVQQWRTMEVV